MLGEAAIVGILVNDTDDGEQRIIRAQHELQVILVDLLLFVGNEFLELVLHLFDLLLVSFFEHFLLVVDLLTERRMQFRQGFELLLGRVGCGDRLLPFLAIGSGVFDGFFQVFLRIEDTVRYVRKTMKARQLSRQWFDYLKRRGQEDKDA